MSGFKAYDDGSTANFILITDNFQIASPGHGGGSPVPVFQIANVGGSAKLAFRGDMYVDGSITTNSIAAGSITAIKMHADSITATNGAIANLTVDTLQVAGNAITVPLTASWS